jgi:hypothetical protein
MILRNNRKYFPKNINILAFVSEDALFSVGKKYYLEDFYTSGSNMT